MSESSTFFRIQVFMPCTQGSTLDWGWMPVWHKMWNRKEADNFYKKTWLGNPNSSVRLVVAFKLDDGRERALSVLQYREGKQNANQI